MSQPNRCRLPPRVREVVASQSLRRRSALLSLSRKLYSLRFPPPSGWAYHDSWSFSLTRSGHRRSPIATPGQTMPRAVGARQRTIACRSNRGRRPQSVRSLAARHYRVRAAQFDGRDGPHRSPLAWQDDPSTWPRRSPSPAALSILFGRFSDRLLGSPLVEETPAVEVCAVRTARCIRAQLARRPATR